MRKECQHSPGYAFKLLWLSCCHGLHYTNTSKFLCVFSPLYLFWQKKFGLTQESLSGVPGWAEPGGQCRATPSEHSRWRCALHLLLPSQAEHSAPGSCSGHVLSASASGETKGEEASQGMWDLWLLMHLLAHTVLQETEHFLCPRGGLITILKAFSPSCCMLIGLWPVPWGCRKILHIFFLLTAPVL